MCNTACTLVLLLSSCGSSPIEDLVVDQVDLVEINHYHDELGRPVFDQIIFYDWSPRESRYQVRAFRMLKSSQQIPRRNWVDGGYDTIWHDGQTNDLLRRVHARQMRETWTQYDPELVEREYLAKDRRRDLTKLPVNGPSQLARTRPAAAPQVATRPDTTRR